MSRRWSAKSVAENRTIPCSKTDIFPGLAISLTVLGFNLPGDGLREALDPSLPGVIRNAASAVASVSLGKMRQKLGAASR
jgi:hypothetical protein